MCETDFIWVCAVSRQANDIENGIRQSNINLAQRDTNLLRRLAAVLHELRDIEAQVRQTSTHHSNILSEWTAGMVNLRADLDNRPHQGANQTLTIDTTQSVDFLFEGWTVRAFHFSF